MLGRLGEIKKWEKKAIKSLIAPNLSVEIWQ
jgi:hypothetical protein